MDLSERGRKLIFDFEGRHTKLADGRYKAYRCPANVPTIYCGLTKGIKDGMVITEAQGEKMFAKELATYEDAVERLVTVPLNQNQFDALTSFVYNVGIGAFGKSTLLKVLNQGKYDQVPGQLLRWNKGGGRVLAGLTRRRKAEGALFLAPCEEDLSPEAVERDPDMPQMVEESKGSLKTAASSPTIQASGVSLFSGIVMLWQWLQSVFAETSAEAATTKQALSGWDGLWSHMGLNLGLILALVIAGSAAVVIARHAKRYLEGTI